MNLKLALKRGGAEEGLELTGEGEAPEDAECAKESQRLRSTEDV